MRVRQETDLLHRLRPGVFAAIDKEFTPLSTGDWLQSLKDAPARTLGCAEQDC